MTTALEKTIDHLWPIGGGTTAGLITLFTGPKQLLLWMSFTQWLETLLIIILGAILGWCVKRMLDFCFPKKRKKYESKKND